MTATIVLEPPKKLDAREVQLINDIWNELTRIYGETRARSPNFLKSHITARFQVGDLGKFEVRLKNHLGLVDKLLMLKGMKAE